MAGGNRKAAHYSGSQQKRYGGTAAPLSERPSENLFYGFQTAFAVFQTVKDYFFCEPPKPICFELPPLLKYALPANSSA